MNTTLNRPDAGLTESRDEVVEMSPFQQRVMAVPQEWSIFLGGGRGSSKSHCIAFLCLRHAEEFGAKARMLYVRQTFRGLADFELITREIFWKIYGNAARFNQTDGVWRFPNGAMLEMGPLEGPHDFNRYQGRSMSLLICDEAGQYATPDTIDILRSNLRGPKGMPLRTVLAANPGGVGHQWLAKRYVFRGAPWIPFEEPTTKSTWIYCFSTYLDNPFIDQNAYRSQLEASCPADPELLKAWLSGDWAIARGAYFANVLDESRNAIDPWKLPLKLRPDMVPVGNGIYLQGGSDAWRFGIGMDFGVSAPAVVYVYAESPGATGPDGRYYPNGSILLLEELSTNAPGQLNTGMGLTVPRLAEEIKEMCKRWKVKPRGVCDDACFANTGAASGSIANEFARAGVYFRPARKADRLSGWQIMRRMLQDAGSPDRPGLYISRSCSYFWSTVPFLSRDPRKVEDLDSRGPDHSADVVRYICLKRDVETRRRTVGV